MITKALRIFLGKHFSPFQFRNAPDYFPDCDVPNLGLYVHIPFCAELCPFCPYFKVRAEPELMTRYLDALLQEIDLVAERTGFSGRNVNSLYFGGGSPAIMINDLLTIRRKIDMYFNISGHTGIELHPRDVNPAAVKKLRDCGFDMASLGIQSFSSLLLSNLGRPAYDARGSLKLLAQGGFAAIDVDLIFGIPGQTTVSLRDDFLKAAEYGATQISTYPFMDFSYTQNKHKPMDLRQKKILLECLLETAREAGFSRTSVWTFGKINVPRYSSITRDCFIGFGPSATTLGKQDFKMNTFSVEAYIEAVSGGKIPTALRHPFSSRTRKVYWLFWNCYNGFLSKKIYSELFGSGIEKDFPFALSLAWMLGIARPGHEGWKLTAYGSYLFHIVEQHYTRQYIDKTWNISMTQAWPEKLFLY
ncbi:MAG: radical SAM protein [Spirochaetaceae bacterium]|nr:MAG: radical SAM protein [Spirochaetaceae bacterium]